MSPNTCPPCLRSKDDPWWGRAVCLSELASLGKPGEGVTLDGRALSLGAQSAAVTPSPRFSKFASSLRETALPHQGGGASPRFGKSIGQPRQRASESGVEAFAAPSSSTCRPKTCASRSPERGRTGRVRHHLRCDEMFAPVRPSNLRRIRCFVSGMR